MGDGKPVNSKGHEFDEAELMDIMNEIESLESGHNSKSDKVLDDEHLKSSQAEGVHKDLGLETKEEVVAEPEVCVDAELEELNNLDFGSSAPQTQQTDFDEDELASIEQELDELNSLDLNGGADNVEEVEEVPEEVSEEVEIKKEIIEDVITIHNPKEEVAMEKSKLDFHVSGEMDMQMNFHVSGQTVQLQLKGKEGLTIQLAGGVKFTVPFEQVEEVKKAS